MVWYSVKHRDNFTFTLNTTCFLFTILKFAHTLSLCIQQDVLGTVHDPYFLLTR
jgi:hypothetical protein